MGKTASGFQAFGLRKPIMNGILKKGYKIPTAIQKKAIPLVIEGKDVIGMSRTGSGKTLAFVLPCFERLYQLEGQSRMSKNLKSSSKLKLTF
jgi:ATP-dependent RNA helicase DDX54/DBP10